MPSSKKVSELAPIDPDSVPSGEEKEKEKNWVTRTLVQSITGRVFVSSYQTLKAAGTNVVCLSPWGDSSPLILPCITFRDLAITSVMAATGGTASVAAPAMGPSGAELLTGSLSNSIATQIVLQAGFEVTTSLADALIFDEPLDRVIPLHSDVLQTTSVKVMEITLRYKALGLGDAALGFYRSSKHEDGESSPKLFTSEGLKEYVSTEKGWFSPYLFASGRRPVIPRSVKPDIAFCHGPFLQGDYAVGETLLQQSAQTISFCPSSTSTEDTLNKEAPPVESQSTEEAPPKSKTSKLTAPISKLLHKASSEDTAANAPAVAPAAEMPMPEHRRMVIVLVGLKPHRKVWTTSDRPGESVIKYVLMNGCPAIVVPVKQGSPLVSWHATTLKNLWALSLPNEATDTNLEFDAVVDMLNEYLELCVDWDRVVWKKAKKIDDKRMVVKNAVRALIAAAVRTKECEAVEKEVDASRSGIATWRII